MKRLIQRLLPGSLTAQIVWAAALALLLAQALNLFLLVRAREQQAMVQASSFAVARMVNILDRDEFGPRNSMPWGENRRRGNLINSGKNPLLPVAFKRQSDLEERALLLLRQNGYAIDQIQLLSGSIKALPDGMDLHSVRWMRPGPRVAMMAHALPDSPPPRQAILLSFRKAGGQWMNVAVPIMPRERLVLGWLILQTLVFYLAVLVPLAFLTHRIARPLRRLTNAVREIDLFNDAPVVDTEGPDDVRRLIGAFNDMQGRVAALLSEKDVMLGAIGHDLKTPLAALRIRVESVDDEEERGRMAASIDEMVTILDDILTLSRLGRSGEQPERTNIEALVQTLVDDASDAGAKITMDEWEGPAIVARVRPVLLRRAMRNLIDNAVKYGGSAHVAIAPEGPRIAIHVDDNGSGIPEDQLERITEPFVRGENSRNRATGGTGLGLALSRAIAAAHGGTLILQNRAEGGLRATIRLPV